MRTGLLVATVAGLALAACAVQRAQVANDAQSKMIGLSREQVLACMGPPINRTSGGETEVWSYNSEVWSYNIAVSTQRFCTVNVVMMAGRVSSLNYAGPTGGPLTAGEQCGFAVQNCVR